VLLLSLLDSGSGLASFGELSSVHFYSVVYAHQKENWDLRWVSLSLPQDSQCFHVGLRFVIPLASFLLFARDMKLCPDADV
jgi:hypothetical protein